MSWLRAWLLVFVFLGPLGVSASPIDSPSAITIGFNPGGDPAQIRTLALELGEALQRQLKIHIEILISKDYEGLVQAMKEKKVDFAFFSAVTFVRAEREAGAKVLLKKVWSDSTYHSVLIAGPKIRKLSDLKGHRVAFVDPASASGYLYPLVYLQQNGILAKDLQIVWTGHHSTSVEMLEKGEVEAAAVFADDSKAKLGAWTTFGKDPHFKPKVLWVSSDIPNDPFAVRSQFYEKYPLITHSLMLALIDIFDEKRDRFSGLLGTKALVPATSRQYDSVRDMVKKFEGLSQ